MEIINKIGELSKLKTKSSFLTEDELVDKKEELLRVKNGLVEYLENTSNAMGISAPQMGIYLPMFAIKLKNGIENFINPKVIDFKQPYYNREGCMSFPDIQAYLIRFNKVEAEYLHINHKGEIKKMIKKLKEYEAAAYQHELDHLMGVTLMDRAAPITEDQAKNLNKIEIQRVFRDEDKKDYFLENENIYFYSGEPVEEIKKEMKDGVEVDIPLRKSFVGFKVKEGE